MKYSIKDNGLFYVKDSGNSISLVFNKSNQTSFYINNTAKYIYNICKYYESTEDIVKLTEIRIKRISKFDSFKADEEIKGVENDLKQVAHDLAHLNDYTIAYFQNLLKKLKRWNKFHLQFIIFDQYHFYVPIPSFHDRFPNLIFQSFSLFAIFWLVLYNNLSFFSFYRDFHQIAVY